MIEALNDQAPLELFEGMTDDQRLELESGGKWPTNGVMVMRKIVQLAAAGTAWATEIVMSYIEGKPGTVPQVDHDSRVMDERINAISVSHLNRIADACVANDADRPVAAEAVAVPGDGPAGTEGT